MVFMLEDFIEFNKLKSKIHLFTSNMSTDMAIASQKLPPKRTVKIQLFNTKSNNPVITIIPYHSELNISMLEKIMGEEEIIEIDSTECLEITGYKKDFLPPISIYGIKTIIDSSLESAKSIFARIGAKKFLEAYMNEVLDTNSDISFEQIVKEK